MSKIYDYKTMCIPIEESGDSKKLDAWIKEFADKGFVLKLTESTNATVILFFEKGSGQATPR